MMYIFLILFLIVVIILFAGGKELEHIYDRKLPKESSAICMYYYNSKFNGKEFWVTLLDLINRDFYKLENINGTRYLVWIKNDMFDLDGLNLKPFEKKVVSFVNAIIYEDRKNKIELELFKAKVKASHNLEKGMEMFYTLLKEEISNTYGFVSPDNKHKKVFLINVVYMFIAAAFTLKINFATLLLILFLAGLSLLISNMLVNTKSLVKNIITIIIAIVMPIFMFFMFLMFMGLLEMSLFLLVNGEFTIGNITIYLLKILYPLLIFVDMLLLKSIRKNKNTEQQKLIDNLLGLRNFMIEFTNTKQKEIDYINFLDKYYVLAVALDVNINYPDYVKSIYDDDTIHTFDCDDFITELEDITTTFVPINRSLRS